jgi:4-aminobutyrate aminotransferase-like enzyme
VDLFAPAGTPVHAPLAGEVAAAGWSAQRFDYGGWVLLRHRTDDGDAFATLYGHLTQDAHAKLAVGRAIGAGEAFAALGDRPENGDWPPHLHLQLLAAGAEERLDTPDGVADPDDFAACAALNPNPAPLLNLPDEATRWSDASVEALRTHRAARFAPNLRLSYAEPFRPVRGWRHFLYDAEGRAYLDAYNNVPHVGHCHPRVVAAAERQLRLLNTNTRYLYDGLAELAERLTAKLPEPLSVCFFVNSGSEANELALRLARAHSGARDMLVMDHAYHGHTTGAMAISPYKFNHPGGGGAEDWVHVTPVPDTYRGPYRVDDPDAGARYAADVRAVLQAVRGEGRRVAGYIAECLPSVGGQIIPPPGFAAAVYRDVRAAGGVCIADDVQTALGRLGATFWGFEFLGVVPDILVLGKPMGNGYPLAAVVTTPAIAGSFAAGPEFFSTFGGSTVSCAVGIAVQQVLDDERLQEHAARVGAELLAGLAVLAGEFPLVGDVRGTGLFIGVELVSDREARTPATAQAAYVKDRLRERRVLVGTEGPHDNVLKIRPPMTFDSAAAARLLETLSDVLKEDPAQPNWAAMG